MPEQAKKLDFQFNENLYPVYVDQFIISTNKVHDNHIISCFEISLNNNEPRKFIEKFRLMAHNDAIKGLIDTLALATGHYPEKPKEPKVKKAESK